MGAEAAREVVDRALEAAAEEDTVGINVLLDREVHGMLRWFSHEFGWTNRQSIEVAVRALDALIEERHDG